MTEVHRATCGIVMPISATDGLTEAHWTEVREIIEAAVTAAGFDPQLVSQSDEAGIIQKRIVENLYTNELVICDVSAKNPNVMFELGMRLAFDKATVVVKDDRTDYSFDTSPIEHIPYPRDLRHKAMEAFKATLTRTLKATHASEGSRSFLKSFGTFNVAQVETKELAAGEWILKEIKELRGSVEALSRQVSRTTLGGVPELGGVARGIVTVPPPNAFAIKPNAGIGIQLEKLNAGLEGSSGNAFSTKQNG